jgi:hypothetical protein
VTRLSISCYPQALFDAYCTSQTYFTLLVTAGIPRTFCLLLVQEVSSSLDIRGCAGRHTTGYCCPLLQYHLTFSLLCSRWGPTTVFLMTWYPHLWISWGLFHAQWWLVDAEHTIRHEISYMGCLCLVIHIIVSVEDSCLEAEVCSINGGICIIDSSEVLQGSSVPVLMWYHRASPWLLVHICKCRVHWLVHV